MHRYSLYGKRSVLYGYPWPTGSWGTSCDLARQARRALASLCALPTAVARLRPPRLHPSPLTISLRATVLGRVSIQRVSSPPGDHGRHTGLSWALSSLLCYVMLCYVMLSYVVLCYVIDSGCVWEDKGVALRGVRGVGGGGAGRWLRLKVLSSLHKSPDRPTRHTTQGQASYSTADMLLHSRHAAPQHTCCSTADMLHSIHAHSIHPASQHTAHSFTRLRARQRQAAPYPQAAQGKLHRPSTRESPCPPSCTFCSRWRCHHHR